MAESVRNEIVLHPPDSNARWGGRGSIAHTTKHPVYPHLVVNTEDVSLKHSLPNLSHQQHESFCDGRQ